MADSSLDDFFAKKDKSKKKSKSKIKPDDILAQQGEEPQKTKKKKSKAQKQTENDTKLSEKENKEDEEWKEFEEEKEADYTGLRIKEMQIAKNEEEEEEEDQGEQEGEGQDRKEGGPWNKVAEAPQMMSEESAAPEPAPKKEVETPKPTSVGKYIPPSRRGAGGEQSQVITPNPLASRKKKKEAPNLRSDFDFPTLGGASPMDVPGGQFEEVKSGGRQADDPSKQRLNLQLDNKFGALEHAD